MTHHPATLPAEPLTPPPLTRWQAGNCGIPCVWRFDSGIPGPAVTIAALTHGNEVCGAHALIPLLEAGLRPRQGILTLLFANPGATAQFNPASPNASRCMEEDMNRLWDAETLDGPGNSADLRRARLLRPVIDATDLLLDLHSMTGDRHPLALTGRLEKGRHLAEKIGLPATIVQDNGHSAGRRMRDYGDFDNPASPKAAVLVECGQHYEAASVSMAQAVCGRFLLATGVAEAADLPFAVPPPQPSRTIRITHTVTVRSPEFRFSNSWHGLDVIGRKGTLLAEDGEFPVVTPYDDAVLIMPSPHARPGQTAVRIGHYLP